MGLLEGSISATLCRIRTMPEYPEFEKRPFEPIPPNSEKALSMGFERVDDQMYELGAREWCFAIRIQKKAPDEKEVDRRLDKYVAARHGCKDEEKARARGELFLEVLKETSPKTSIIEGVIIQGKELYLFDTSDEKVSDALELLAEIDILAVCYAPWMDSKHHPQSNLVKTEAEHESLHGSNMIRWAMAAESRMEIDCRSGSIGFVKPTQGEKTGGSYSGALGVDEFSVLEDDRVIILKARVICGHAGYVFIGKSFRISGMKTKETGLVKRLSLVQQAYTNLIAEYHSYATAFLEAEPRSNPHTFLLSKEEASGFLPGVIEAGIVLGPKEERDLTSDERAALEGYTGFEEYSRQKTLKGESK